MIEVKDNQKPANIFLEIAKTQKSQSVFIKINYILRQLSTYNRALKKHLNLLHLKWT